MTNLINILTDNTQDLKKAFIEKTIDSAKSTFAHCEKMYNLSLSEKYDLFNVPYEMVKRLGSDELTPRMKRVFYNNSKYEQTPVEYYEYLKQNDKWYSVKSLGLDSYIAKELRHAEIHYQNSIIKLADRLTKKGITEDFTITSGKIGVNFEIIINHGETITKAWTIIAEGPIQRPHYRYLIK